MKLFFKGFGFALNGIREMIKRERNFRFELVIFVLVIIAGAYFSISLVEWIAVLTVSALVLSLEMINTSVEKICDLYSKENDNRIKVIKDVAAGAVLVSAVIAAIIGVIVFWKYFVALIGSF